MTWIIKRNGIRTRVIPGQRPSGCDPDEFYESDLVEERIEHLQGADWHDQAEVLETYMDPEFAKLVAFVCSNWSSFGCDVGTPERIEKMNEIFTGLAEEASKRLGQQIEEHLKSTWGRREYEPHYCEEE